MINQCFLYEDLDDDMILDYLCEGCSVGDDCLDSACIDALIEERRIAFRTEWFDYVADRE